MSTDLLVDVAVDVMHGLTIFILKTSIYNVYMSIHPQKMMASFFIDVWFIRYLYVLQAILLKGKNEFDYLTCSLTKISE